MNDNKDLYEQVNAEIDLVTDKSFIETTKPPKYSVVTKRQFPCILIQSGKYSTVKVRFGKVWGPNEKVGKTDDVVDANQIRFQYEIMEDKNGKTIDKKDDPHLMSVLGSILVELMLNDRKKYQPKLEKQAETKKKTYKERKTKSR